MDLLLAPFRAFVSRPARRAYLTTALLLATSVCLLAFASFAYIVFYNNYIPQIGIERVLHLQYGNGNPSALIDLEKSIVPKQPYDVTLTLSLPTSPSNIKIGNFMLDLSLYAEPPPKKKTTRVLHSRRPAIMTYNSPLLSTMSTLMSTPLLLVGLKRQQETLSVKLVDSSAFSTAVKSAKIEIEVPGMGKSSPAGSTLAIYDAKLRFEARFHGIRWLMYNYWITSFLVGTLLFWAFEMTGMAVMWYLVSSKFLVTPRYLSAADEDDDYEDDMSGDAESTDAEEEEAFTTTTAAASDVQRGFPRYRNQPPLAYPTPEPEERIMTPESVMSGTATTGGEADDEEEELGGGAVDVGRDSGLGSMSESTGRAGRGEGSSMSRRRAGRGD